MHKSLETLLAELRGEPRNEDRLASLIRLRRTGYTLRQVALASGVHVATVCRWMKRDSALREAMREAKKEARQQLRPEDDSRPQVPWRRDCPLCKAKVVVRSARGKARFWRCGRWPECPWSSWRPRASRNCRQCKAPRYWSHSRKSIVCSGCGVRTRAP